MKAKTFALVTVLATGLLLVNPVPSCAQTPATFSWSTTPPNVASVSWTDQQIAAFLDSLTGSLLQSEVGDFKFVDLDGDGQLELLASMDLSGRSQFNLLAVVRRAGNNFTVQRINTLAAESLSGTFADIDNDGKQELLVSTPLTPYQGGPNPQAKWTAIYGWSGPLLIDVSSRSSQYYQSTILPGLKETLDDLEATAPGTVSVDVAQMEYDKALRVSGVDPNAGFALAISWTANPDPMYRIFAAAILADIGTPDAITALQSLETDQDPQVVTYAEASVHKLADLHFTSVGIDIKPGDSTNPIMPESSGKVPVAILSTPTFDAPAQVNANSLTFGSAGTEDSLAFCNAKGEDVNGDGLLDLVCHFDTQASSFQPGDALGVLRGKLKTGTDIKGLDSVRIINK